MSPRPYRLGRREAANEETRGRVLTAARLLLADPASAADFSMESVARRADVARMTIYYQFGSRRGLLEALFDELAVRGHIGENLAAAFQRADAPEALERFISAFVTFWDTDRPAMRRLRSLTAFDEEFEQAVRARDERRRLGVQAILARLATSSESGPSSTRVADAADLLFTLSSFETFDTLAGSGHSAEDVARLIGELARSWLGIEGSTELPSAAEPALLDT